jgi:hypothetical protein
MIRIKGTSLPKMIVLIWGNANALARQPFDPWVVGWASPTIKFPDGHSGWMFRDCL